MNNKGTDQSVHPAGWSGPLLFVYPEDMFSCVEAHMLLYLKVVFDKINTREVSKLKVQLM